MNTPVKLSLVIGMLMPLSPEIFANNIFEDGKFDLMNRNFYFYRDFRNGGANPSGANSQLPISEREGYRSEWAHGIIGQYSSGFTEGAVQIGFDAYGMVGIKLYSDEYKTGTNLITFDPKTGETKDAYGEVGGAVKVKYKDTVLTYGNQFPNVPVIATSTVRLLPTVSTGVSLQDKTVDNLVMNAGYFYSMNPLDSTHDLNYFTTDYAAGIKADSISFLGGAYKLPAGSVTLYASELEDVWNQYFLGATYQKALNDPDQKIKAAFAGYSNNDTGEKIGGDIDAHIASALVGYQYQNHTISVGYQQVFGNEPFDWVGFSTIGGNSSILNAAQFATFSEAKEKSWQIKYEADFAPYGLPGLSLMARYIYGWDIDNSRSNNPYYTKRHVYDTNIDTTHWERDIQLAYKVPTGFAKGMDIKLRQATHRAVDGYRYNDIDELRVIIEYPLSF
ncbi:OprD family outer membrane porin [Acinetobacter sp. ANC 3813]|uniref:OprD family outer membrane porin n=1 Tax=Acinetobacter sp. ANC 3813 TaxID=1977873 RepID=UPI000A349866|nr:OprD family outer membrane porin [Acinetobacter sp. ANC 3813]OTG90829.1 porin [Acinetobacter sp. ANC 3813]